MLSQSKGMIGGFMKTYLHLWLYNFSHPGEFKNAEHNFKIFKVF